MLAAGLSPRGPFAERIAQMIKDSFGVRGA
jgi:hypothetical protein